MVAQSPDKPLMIRWATLKGLLAIALFAVTAIVAEYLVVLYAMSLGVKDPSPLQWSFRIPATDWTGTIAVSPLFHLVPISVVITLLFTWTYLTKRLAIKPRDVWKGKAAQVARQKRDSEAKKYIASIKSRLAKARIIVYLQQKAHLGRATVRSAFMVFIVFLSFVIVASLLAYPQLIYRAVSSAYRSNASLLDFVRATGQAFALFGVVGGAFTFAMPGFRDAAVAFGNVLKPLADLDNAGKYLVFQNIAAWIAALGSVFYVEYLSKGYRYRKLRRS